MAESTPQDKGAAEAPEYATKDQMQSLAAEIQSLKEALTAAPESAPDPTDQSEIDRLYRELEGAKAEQGQDDPQEARFRTMEKQLKKIVAGVEAQGQAQRATDINATYRKKYPDWEANESDLWKMAKKHGTLKPDEVYALWKLSKEGPDALTPKEKRTAVGAAAAAKEAQRAVSEKPTTGAADKTREYSGDWNAMFKDTWDALPEKPAFGN